MLMGLLPEGCQNDQFLFLDVVLMGLQPESSLK